MRLTFEHNSVSFSIDLTPAGKSYLARMEDKTVEVEILYANDNKLDLLMDGKPVTVYLSSENTRRWVTVHGQTFVLNRSSGRRRGGHGHHHAAGELTAPMPGQIRALNVGESEAVTKGQTLLVLEAMKMEIRLQAPFDGVVGKLYVEQGQTVEREQILAEIEES